MHSCCALLPFTKYSYWWGEAPAGFAAPTLGADQPSRLYLSAPTTHWEESATSDPPGTGWLRSALRNSRCDFEGHLRLFLNKIRPTPLEPPCHPAPRFGPFFRLVRGPRAAVAPQGGQGGLGGARSSVSTRAQERIPTCLVVIRALVCRRSMAVGVISARMSPVGITVGSDHDGRLSLSARLLLTAIR